MNAYNRGIGFFNAGQYESAIAAFQEALAHAPKGTLDEQLSCFYLAESYSALALAQAGDATVEGIAAEGVARASPALGVARGRSEKTAQTLRGAVTVNPGYADLHYHLARVYLSQDLLADALASADRALALNPRFARASLLRGCILFAQGRQDEGIREAVRAIVREPFLSRSAVRVSVAAYRAGDHAASLLLLRQAVSEEAGEPDELITHAHTLGCDGQYQEAIDMYRRALEKYPDYADLRNGFGMALHATEQYADAAREFERAIRLNPRYLAAHLNRGLSLEKLGRIVDARDEYRIVVALEPEQSVARVRLAAMNVVAEGIETGWDVERETA